MQGSKSRPAPARAGGVGPLVRLDGVTLYREGRKVLDDVSFGIRRGEHWALLGPNGCGKSSLMAVLQGLLWPIEGTMEVLGRRFGEDDIAEMRRFIGWVGNDLEPQFPQGQSVEEIVLSGAVGTVGLQFDAPSAADRRRARRLLREVGLETYRQRPHPWLSQGQKRLVTIARALMTRPGLLILDEPAAGLDPVARELFLAKLRGLMRLPGGPGILYVTHHVEEIVPGFTHAAILAGGRFLAAGPVASALTATHLGRAFGHPVRLLRAGGRYALRLSKPRAAAANR